MNGFTLTAVHETLNHIVACLGGRMQSSAHRIFFSAVAYDELDKLGNFDEEAGCSWALSAHNRHLFWHTLNFIFILKADVKQNWPVLRAFIIFLTAIKSSI